MKKTILALAVALSSMSINAKTISIADSENSSPCSSIMEAAKVTMLGRQYGYDAEKMISTSFMIAEGLEQRKVLNSYEARLFATGLAFESMRSNIGKTVKEKEKTGSDYSEGYYAACKADNLDNLFSRIEI